MKSKVYVIFGAGKAGRDFLQLFSGEISYFVDNDPAKWGTFHDDIPVYSPERLLQEEREKLKILIASMYFDQIDNQLQAMGFKKSQHYWNVIPYYPFFAPQPVSFFDLIDVNELGRASSAFNLFERQKMIFTVQNDLVSLQEKRLLLVVEPEEREQPWILDAERMFKEFFKLDVLKYCAGLPECKQEMQGIACKYQTLGFDKVLFLGKQGVGAEQFGECFRYNRVLSRLPDKRNKRQWLDALYETVNELGFGFEKVSAIIPNYNYERYLSRRIRSVTMQYYPVYEIIFLDDASSDDSVMLAECLLESYLGLKQVVVNQENSGSVFKQWRRGIEASHGEYIWIAEADDHASPALLPRLMSSFVEDTNVSLSFCDSMLVNGQGEWEGFYADAYACYLQSSPGAGYIAGIHNGRDFIRRYLSSLNSIPNVSAVVMQKAAIRAEYLEKLAQFKTCGDWYLYILLLAGGNAACHTIPLNFFCRHSCSVTINSSRPEQVQEQQAVSRLLHEVLGDD